MSETWKSTRTAVQRLREALSNADEDTVYRFVFWCIGMIIMASAIVVQFGWVGVSFLVGVVFWAAGTSTDQ